jgi:Tfp pilus assembly protein PilO
MKTIAVMLISIALPAFIYTTFVRSGRFEALQQRAAQLRSIEADVADGRAAARKLPQFHAELHRIEYEHDQLLVRLPELVLLPEAVRSFEEEVRRVAAKRDCKVITSNPFERRPTVVFVDVAVEGDAAALIAVIHDVESLRQLVSVSKVKLVPAPKSSVGFVATVHAF